MLSAVGALLATALIVVPAAATRLVCRRLRVWQVSTVLLVAVLGIGGLWLSVETDAPPGATIAVLSGAAFVLAAAVRAWRARRPGRPSVAAAAASVLALVGVGCGASDDAATGDRVKVVATTTQVADIARSVGGDDVEVVQLLQPNSDPHDYEPRPSDLREAAGAALLLTSGDGLDAWAGDVAEQVGLQDSIVDLGAGRPVVLPAPGGDGADPHWWHDPRNVDHAIGVLRDALVRVAPDRRAAVDAAAARYRTRVAELDRASRACINRVPAPSVFWSVTTTPSRIWSGATGSRSSAP